MKKTLFAGVAALLLAGAAVAAMDLQSELDNVVKAEKAFSAMSIEKGQRDAFLAYLADDSVLFRPEPVPGKAFTRENDPPPIVLIWRPVYADIAGSADLAYTTGPYEIRKPDTKQGVGGGQFISVWKKQADGSWKVALDIGIAHGRPGPGDPLVDGPDTPIRLAAGRQPTAAVKDVAAGRADLLMADRDFSKASAAQGTAAAYAGRLADDVRLYRWASKVYLGKEAAQGAVAAQTGRMTWEPQSADVSRAGDLGYTYGTYELAGTGQETEKGHYLRIWKRQGGGPWKLALDVTNPPPPPQPPSPPQPPQPAKPPGSGA